MTTYLIAKVCKFFCICTLTLYILTNGVVEDLHNCLLTFKTITMNTSTSLYCTLMMLNT